MNLYQEGERATHVAQDNTRSNGTIIKAHTDEGFEYYTILLDSGREVQTVGNRLKKGEYTGVESWQRVLDENTECYFFFHDDTQETMWDTPEARESIFGPQNQYRPYEEQQQQPTSPVLAPMQQQQQQQQQQSSSPLPAVTANPRAAHLAQSSDFRQALILTGSASLQRNLQTLGIQVASQPEPVLAQVLAVAISKVSLTLEEDDLFLLIHHCLGGRQDTAQLARALSNPNPPDFLPVVEPAPPRRAPPQVAAESFLEDQQHSFVEERAGGDDPPRNLPPPARDNVRGSVRSSSFDSQYTQNTDVTYDRPPSRRPPTTGRPSSSYKDPQQQRDSKRKYNEYADDRRSYGRGEDSRNSSRPPVRDYDQSYRDDEDEERRRYEEWRRWQDEEEDRRRYYEEEYERRRFYEEEQERRRYYEDLERARFEDPNLRRMREGDLYRGAQSPPARLEEKDRLHASDDQLRSSVDRQRLEDDRLFDDPHEAPFPTTAAASKQEEEVKPAPSTPVIDFAAPKPKQDDNATPAPSVEAKKEEEQDPDQSFKDIATVQSDMDKLLQTLANANNIDSGWRAQHEETQKELQASEEQIRHLSKAAAKPAAATQPQQEFEPQPRMQKVAPPPSKACGVCSLM